MVKHKYTDQLAATKPLQDIWMKKYVEIKQCVEMNTQTNWLIDTNLSVDCRILIIAEFDMKLFDCSKKAY